MERRLRFFQEQINLDALELEATENNHAPIVELDQEVEEQPNRDIKDINDLEVEFTENWQHP